MSLTSALNSAMSGLAAAGRASLIVSDNIANAATPGYGRRSLEVATDANIGSGVRVLGVTRHSDPALIASRRVADADHAGADVRAGFYQDLQRLVDGSLDGQSLTARLAGFENALIAAASAPESAVRLDSLAQAAIGLANGISGAAQGVQSLRSDADRAVGGMIEQLNSGLQAVQKLNTQIAAAGPDGAAAALMDQRQVILDQINQIVPVNVVDRTHGHVALYTDGGAILLDGSAAELGFDPAPLVTPYMTAQGGDLSGFTIGDMPIRSDALRGGALQAQIQIRDELGPQMAQQLDALTADLITRFEDSGLDPTRMAGDPGLFTDAGAPMDPTALTGLATRLQVVAGIEDNAWRLRDGLGAAVQGDLGNAALLHGLSDALTQGRMVDGRLQSAGDLTADLVAGVAAQVHAADQTLSFAAVGREELQRLELEQGVDTDTELQTLMLVERAYAANARIVQAVDEMMQTILRI